MIALTSRLNERDEDTLNNFKFKIMQYVLSNRIYKDEDIEILRANLIKINCKIFTEEEINEILNIVIIDLDSQRYSYCNNYNLIV